MSTSQAVLTTASKNRSGCAGRILIALAAMLCVSACGGGGSGDGSNGPQAPATSAPPPPNPPPDTTAPAISISAPSASGSYTSTSATVSVTGTASDNVGVTEVTWVNSRGGSGAATGTTSWSAANVALQSGSNEIAVTARDAAGNTQSATINVTYSAPVADTQAPTAPGSLVAEAVSATRVNLSWNASTDNTGVDHYDVFRDAVAIVSTADREHVDAAAPSTTYTYTVKAVDAAGNVSAASNVAAVTTPVSTAAGGWPTSPPAQICDNPAFLAGPVTAPAGAVTVDVGDNLETLTADNPAGTIFWLKPGMHLFTYSIVPKDGNTYIGAPGAIIDGGGTINTAFWEEFYGRKAQNVTLSYLTIQNFTSSGQDQGSIYAGLGWKINHSTLRNHGYVALFAGPDNTIDHNCFDSNGQLAIGTFRFDDNTYNVTVDHNEFKNNNTRNLQNCGCGGGMKWWTMKRGKFTNNWVHHNRGAGVWGDTNNIELLFEGNFISDNDGTGLFYEISYNFMIRYNTIVRNAKVDGAALNGNFPIAAIYISESGGIDEPGYLYATSEIHHNYLQDNWDGVALWESGNRYAGSDGLGYRPAFGDPIHWKTQNIIVHDNEFHMDKTVVACVGNPNCGRNGLFSDWVPVPGGDPAAPNSSNDQYQVAVTFGQNNTFRDNKYFGSWAFVGYDKDLLYGRSVWRNPQPTPPSSFNFVSPGTHGFGQDAGSTFDGQP